nr:formin-like protein 5 [Aegilops tauschii subsp. strangulata]
MWRSRVSPGLREAKADAASRRFSTTSLSPLPPPFFYLPHLSHPTRPPRPILRRPRAPAASPAPTLAPAATSPSAPTISVPFEVRPSPGRPARPPGPPHPKVRGSAVKFLSHPKVRGKRLGFLPRRLPPPVPAQATMFQLGSAPGKGFWARHRWKMLLSLGVAGAGYAAYRFYDTHQKQLVRVEQRRGGARRR